MNNRFRVLLAFGVAACMPVPTSAAGFTGTFTTPITYEDNIYTGVSLTTVNSTITVTHGAGPNDLNLSLSFDSGSASVPLVIDGSGDLATLAPGDHTVGMLTIRDALLFSDGNNMALACVADEASSGMTAYVVSAWQQTPSLADPESAVGQWDFTSVRGSPNLGGGTRFGGEKSGWFNIENTGSGYAVVVDPIGLNVPLTAAPGSFSMASAPIRAGTGDWHMLNWTFDREGKGAMFIIGVEPDDPTDVSITVGLMTLAVPEPETYAMLLAGLGLLGVISKRRIRVS